MITLVEMFEEQKHEAKRSLNILPNIPNAELNAILGIGLSVTAALYDSTISLSSLIGSALLYIHQKRQQDSVINEFNMFKFGASDFGHKPITEIPLENPIVQKSLRGLTHLFFRKPADQLQDNSDVIKLASALQISRRNACKDVPFTLTRNNPGS